MDGFHSLLDPLRTMLKDALLEQEGVRFYDVEIDRVIHRPYSDVAFLRCKSSGGDRRLVLKKTVHHPENISITKKQNQAVVEFEILSKLYPLFQSVPRCSVPRPIVVMPEQEAYVMGFVEGRLLGDRFGSAKYFSSIKSFNELREFYYLCGLWLKKLHEFTGIRRAGKGAFDYTLERCEQRLKMIENARHPSCPLILTDAVRRYLEHQMHLVKDEDIWVTGRHGDFGSWNIMAGQDGVTVFDFLGYQEDLLPIDLIKMMMNFEIEKGYLFFSANRIKILKSAFLQGYGELPRVTAPILGICETLHRVCSLSACVSISMDSFGGYVERTRLTQRNILWLKSDHKELLWGTTVAEHS